MIHIICLEPQSIFPLQILILKKKDNWFCKIWLLLYLHDLSDEHLMR